MPNRPCVLASVPGKVFAAGRLPYFFDRSRAAISVFLLLASVAFAQTPARDTSKPPDQNTQKSSGGSAVKKPTDAVTLLDEKSIIFPDIAASTEPLTAGQKFELFVDNSISVHTVLYSALGSAVSQADNSPTGYGQGWDAYGKRFGSSMARNASAEFFGTFILSSAMHYDPRFFPDRDPSFGQAVGHSLKRIFVTHRDSGGQVLDIPGLTGPLLAEGLANAYWPDRNRTVGDTFMRYGIDLAAQAGGNMLREYWPVVYRKLTHSASSR
jgi:hypothetical protein